MNAAELEVLIERGWVVDHDNEDFYAGLADDRLRLDRCRACGRWQHPPKPICPACWSDDIGPADVRGTGTVVLWTVYRAIDPVFGLIPFAGDIFDVAFRSNSKNAALLEQALADPAGARRSSRWTLLTVGLGFLAVTAAGVYGTILLTRWAAGAG